MIEEPFQRALKLEVFANTIRRDLSDLLHISDVSPIPLNITSEALGERIKVNCAFPLESFKFLYMISTVCSILQHLLNIITSICSHFPLTVAKHFLWCPSVFFFCGFCNNTLPLPIHPALLIFLLLMPQIYLSTSCSLTHTLHISVSISLSLFISPSPYISLYLILLLKPHFFLSISPNFSLSLSLSIALSLSLTLTTAYEVPFFCRLDAVNKLLDEKALTPAEVSFEIARLHGRDSCRLRGNDPFAMSNLPWRCNGQSMIWSSKPTFLWLCSPLFWFSNIALLTIGLDAAALHIRIESSFNPRNFLSIFTDSWHEVYANIC